jgi:hypothetical protein
MRAGERGAGYGDRGKPRGVNTGRRIGGRGVLFVRSEVIPAAASLQRECHVPDGAWRCGAGWLGGSWPVLLQYGYRRSVPK